MGFVLPKKISLGGHALKYSVEKTYKSHC